MQTVCKDLQLDGQKTKFPSDRPQSYWHEILDVPIGGATEPLECDQYKSSRILSLNRSRSLVLNMSGLTNGGLDKLQQSESCRSKVCRKNLLYASSLINLCLTKTTITLGHFMHLGKNVSVSDLKKAQCKWIQEAFKTDLKSDCSNHVQRGFETHSSTMM